VIKQIFTWILVPAAVAVVVKFSGSGPKEVIGGFFATLTLLAAGAAAALGSTNAHQGRVQSSGKDLKYLWNTLAQLARLSKEGNHLTGRQRRDAANGLALIGLLSASAAVATALIWG
jgi:hypothetical protein